MLSEQVRAVIKSTVPVLAEHGLAITQAFYKGMFTRHPELKNVFNQSNQREGKQPQALAGAVYAAAAHIDNLEAILPAIQHIGHKHRALNVKAEHYPIVGENLLLAIKEVLGSAATDEIISAWGQAYGVIAQVFIDMEAKMYAEMYAKGGWTDYKPFVVEKKVAETDRITSFYLRPEDGSPLPLHEAGQYITVLGQDESWPYTQPRQYSLSMLPNTAYYRISVKREDGSLVSRHLHEHIQEGHKLQLSAPAGNFVIDQGSEPLMLLAGGVGATPLLSMLHTELARGTRPIHWVQAVEDGAALPFAEEIQALKAQYPQLQVSLFFRQPSAADKAKGGFNEGLIAKDFLQTQIQPQGRFYFCGPIPFMQHVRQELLDLGVSQNQMAYEIFGPAVGM